MSIFDTVFLRKLYTGAERDHGLSQYRIADGGEQSSNSFKGPGITGFLFALIFIAGLGFSAHAKAQTVLDLVLCLDASGSMSDDDWTLEKAGTTAGLSAALNPDFLTSEVRVAVVQFPLESGTPGSAGVAVVPTVINSLATLTAFNVLVNNLVKPTSSTGTDTTAWTNIASCIDVARESLDCGTVAAPAACPAAHVRRNRWRPRPGAR